MGLQLEIRDPAWGCLRNAAHRGRNPRRLVQKLLDCSFEHALSIVELQSARIDEFDELAEKFFKQQATEAAAPLGMKPVEMPKEFKSLRNDDSDFSARFLRYIAGRGFGNDVYDVCDIYDLRYCLTGAQAHRVVMPIRMHGKLISWTGRDIRSNASRRYRNMDDSDKTLLFNYDVAVAKMGDCTALVMDEGPFDTYKVDYYGYDVGCTAVGILGTAVPSEQLAALATLLKGFELGIMLLDADAALLNMQMADQLRELSQIPVVAIFIDQEMHDPGKMTKMQVQQICARAVDKIRHARL